MWLKDWQRWAYFPVQADLPLVAVGWLENGRPFKKRTPNERTLAALEILFAYDESRMMLKYDTSGWAAGGWHSCDLCGLGHHGPRGYANLFVRGKRWIFACPDLIGHYVKEHHYAPPRQFISALLNEPPPVIFDQRVFDNMVARAAELRKQQAAAADKA